MDAKAEAEKQWPVEDDAPESWKDEGNAWRGAFMAGAAWALREFGDVLTREGWSHSPTWFAAEAHHIADRIEEGK